MNLAYSQKAEFKIMSFNIRCGQCDNNNVNNWTGRKALVTDVITNYTPDLVGFQEMIGEQKEFISQQFPNLGFYGSGRDQDRNGEGCYIFYNKNRFEVDSANSGTFWFSSTPDVPGTTDMGDIYKRICTYVRLKDKTDGKYFYHCNTHITYIDTLQGKYLDFLVAQLTKRLTQPDPVVLTGDFNADENNAVVKKFMNYNGAFKFSDTYRMLHPDGEAGTFHAFTGKPTEGKIDYIFINANLMKPIEAEIIRYNKNGLYPTDHFIIYSKLQYQ